MALSKREKKVLALGRLPAGVMNKTEAAFAQHLEMLKRAGEIIQYDFEPETFKLAKKTSYTPDFRVLTANRDLIFYDVKGFWRDDARAKIKICAEQNPMYRFIAVKKAKQNWEIEEFTQGE
nr:MAG TPA: Endonuclease [Caudoviricetes sp.]